MRPQLRPGLQVLRRDVHTLQLGLDWPGVVVLEDSPALQAVLRAIDGIRDVAAVVMTAARQAGVAESSCRAALEALIDCGAVVDQAQHLRGSVTEPAWAATWLLAGPAGGAPDLAAAKDAHALHVVGSGQVADGVRALAARHDVRLAGSSADVLVVASDHEPSRDVSDRVMADGRPHLWAVVRELVGVLGPFVQPGDTACLRCVDRSRARHDPAWPTLVESAAGRPGHVHACDPVLASLIAIWAVQEVSVWMSGLRPQTLGRTIEVPVGVGVVEAEHHLAHPACGCGWSWSHDTMGA
ncbi:MAG TPA: hypothetical protein VH419_04010 [Nocardioidaceae bacterium]